MSILYTQSKEEITPALLKELGLQNIHQVPTVNKVVVNVGYGRHHKDKSYIDNVEKTLTTITGQKPVHNKARKSISNFKIREGMDNGMSVTLRGKVMYDFLYRLIHLTIPRIRDFRGLDSNAFDRQGNYTLGLKESVAFPEITGDALDKVHGLQVVICTTAKSKADGTLLLKKMGLPLKEA